MKAVVMVACLLYNFALVAGTAYLIAFHDWSVFWFLVTALFIVTVRYE